MVHYYYEFAFRRRRFRVVRKGSSCLGLVMVHMYYDLDLPSRRLRVDQKGVLV
jgi:hypothetical protein